LPFDPIFDGTMTAGSSAMIPRVETEHV
jgi:hypothetical protein